MRRVYGTKVARLTLGEPPLCLVATGIVRCRDGVAEVSRGRMSGWNQPAKGRTCSAGWRPAFRWRQETQHTGMRYPVPALSAAAGSRKGKRRVRQTPRRGRNLPKRRRRCG
jgi:hypothetical protein